MPRFFTIRESLQGHLSDYIKESKFDCTKTESLVRDIVCLLAAYREEDKPLYPCIYVFDTEEILNTLAPGTEKVKIGTFDYKEDSAKDVLKNCASLAFGGWSVYLHKNDASCFEYGVFRSRLHSFSISAEEQLVSLETVNPILLIRNRGHLVVEIIGGGNQPYPICFTPTKSSFGSLATHVEVFTDIATIDSDKETQVLFRPYLKNLIIDLLL
jgi:hypothetical protein